VPDTPPRPRPPGTLKIGTIAGSDVLVSSSWFLVAGLMAVLFAPAAENAEPGLGAWKYVAGLAFAVILYLSVLLHEASHAIVARRLGFPVTSITLHFLGGMTAIEGEARKPGQEFYIAVVGPLTSVAVGLLALVLRPLTPGGLPLDGGRVLKSLVWRLTGNVHRGTIIAGWGGRLTAVAVLLWPLLQQPLLGDQPDILDFVLSFVVAAFLWSGSTAAMVSARVRSRLPNLQARQLARRTLAVPGDLPLAEAVRRARDAEAGSIVTVTGSGVPVGIVNEAALAATPEDRRPWMAVSAVARTLEEGLRLSADLAGEDLVMAINRTPAAEYLLVEPDGALVGVLATADVDRAFGGPGH
jgi:Zn-dependent protease